MRLAVKGRILLHLLESAHSAEGPEFSPAFAQEGVADAVGIERRHLAQFVHPLMEGGLVTERQAHVSGIRQRRKVYELTSSGRWEAIRLRAKLDDQTVRDGHAIRSASSSEISRGVTGRPALFEAVQQVQEAGVVGLDMVGHPPVQGFVEQLSDAPRIETFVGRQEELEEVLREDGSARIYVVRGVAGIGKTAFAAKACDALRGRRNLFWHRIRPWDSEQALLAGLGRFLESLDRPGLGSVLKRGQVWLAPEVLRQDLPDTHAVLVFDDAHESSPEALGFFRMLTDSVAPALDVRILILTRRALPFYDLRDVALRGIVREIELRPLRSHEAAALLAIDGDPARLEGLSKRLAGHPLFIDLVRRHHYDVPEAVKDVERFIEETVYRGLSEAEKVTMKAASSYEVPIPRQTLLSIPGSSYEALASLRDRSLIRLVCGERYEIHDTIREFFRRILTPAESRRLGALAVDTLRDLAATAYATNDFVSCTEYLSNAIRLAPGPQARGAIQEASGDAEARMGDLPAAMVWYRDAVRASPNPETAVRLHRKLADALRALGEISSASAEVDAALQSLGEAGVGERGWLDLVRSRMSIVAEAWPEGQAHAEAAIRTFRSYHDPQGLVEALIELAVVHISSPAGNPMTAKACLEEALSRSGSAANPSLAAKVQAQLANLYAYRLGDADQAMAHLAAVESLPGAFVDIPSRQSLLMLEAWLNLDLRADFPSARSAFDAAFALSNKVHDPINAALAKQGAAMARYHAGEWAAALVEFDAAAAELLALGYVGSSIEAQYSAAEGALALGDPAEFRRRWAHMQESSLARGLEVRPVLAFTLRGLECVGKRDRAGAHAALEEAIRLAEEERSPQERSLISSTHDTYGIILRAMGEGEKAQDEQRVAVATAEQFGLKGRLVARITILPKVEASLRRMYTATQLTRLA